MPSFVRFSGGATAMIWNSTFKTVHQTLEQRSGINPMAARALRDNPIAATVGMLDLTSFSHAELTAFMELMSELTIHAPGITRGWTFPQQIRRFPDDLQTLIQHTTEAANFTDATSTKRP